MLDPLDTVNTSTLPELATVAQVAAFLQYHEDTVIARIKANAIGAMRLGEGPTGHYLIPRASLALFLEARRVHGSDPKVRATREKLQRNRARTGRA